MKSTGLVFASRDYIGSTEPPATVLEDESRFGSDGAFEADGQPNWVRLPSGLWVMDFNSATTDWVEITATQLDFTSEDFSIVMAVRLDSTAGTPQLLCRGWYFQDGYRFVVLVTGEVQFETNQLGAGERQTSGTGTNYLALSTWYTVGMSRAGASVRLFINGVDKTVTADTHIDPLTSARSAKIGIFDNKSSFPFDGQIVLVRIYNYALSAGKVKQIFEAERHWFGV